MGFCARTRPVTPAEVTGRTLSEGKELRSEAWAYHTLPPPTELVRKEEVSVVGVDGDIPGSVAKTTKFKEVCWIVAQGFSLLAWGNLTPTLGKTGLFFRVES